MGAKETKAENSALILDKMVTDYGPTKYNDLVWAMAWARHLKRQEEFRPLTMAQLIDKAIEDIFYGRVKPEDVLAAHSKDIEMMEAAPKKPEAGKGDKKEEKDEKASKK